MKSFNKKKRRFTKKNQKGGGSINTGDPNVDAKMKVYLGELRNDVVKQILYRLSEYFPIDRGSEANIDIIRGALTFDVKIEQNTMQFFVSNPNIGVSTRPQTAVAPQKTGFFSWFSS